MLALSEDDEAEFREVLALLARTGDRAGALRAYDDFAARLKQEYEAVPDARTRAISSRFHYQGNGGSADLAQGMASALGVNLDGAGDLRDVGARALLNAMGSGPAPLDAAHARDVADRLGTGLYVVGDILETGDRLRITATLHDAAGGSALEHATADGRAEDIFAIVDELAVRPNRSAGTACSRIPPRTTYSISRQRTLVARRCTNSSAKHPRRACTTRASSRSGATPTQVSSPGSTRQGRVGATRDLTSGAVAPNSLDAASRARLTGTSMGRSLPFCGSIPAVGT